LILDAFKSINDTLMENIKELNRLISKLAERVENWKTKYLRWNLKLNLRNQAETKYHSQKFQTSHRAGASKKKFFRHTTGRKQRTQQQTDNARMRIFGNYPEYLRSLYKR